MCIDHGKNTNLCKEGYTKVSWFGKQVRLHRLVYCLINGISLEEIKDKLVLHSCDNPRCVDPTHLRLGTHKENMEDKVFRKRTHNRKFSEDEVNSIRQNVDQLTQQQFACLFGVTPLTISKIQHRKTYYEV